MRYLYYFIILVISFILQSTFFESVAVLGIKPNIILIVIVSIALLRGDAEGTLTGFLGGLMLDTFAPFIGVNAFIGIITGCITGTLTTALYKENPFVPVTAVFAATFFYDFAFYVLNILLEGYTDFGYFFGTVILREMVYNALWTLPVYGIICFVNSRIELTEHFKRKLF